MDINELIAIVKKKLNTKIKFEDLKIEDKSFLHKNHPGNQKDKFHLKIVIKSKNLRKMTKIESNKKIYEILSEEIHKYIHSIQISIQ
tara:strand:+ start:339 stop:599 length:261 start_codon:yes stop_codon:yes gene_type:complete